MTTPTPDRHWSGIGAKPSHGPPRDPAADRRERVLRWAFWIVFVGGTTAALILR